MYDNFVWAEKYRPKKLEQMILPPRMIEEARGFIAKGTIPSLLLTGSAGIGKTTLGFVLCNELDYDVMLVNCSDEGRFLDTFRNKVAGYCSSVSLDGKRKCIILDEIDNLTDDVYKLLRGFIEKFSGNCSFIATCNYVNRLPEPIRSRFSEIEFKFTAEEKKDLVLNMFKAICTVLEAEKVSYDKVAVSKLVGKYYPDFRRLLNELQRYASTGNIDSGIFVSSSEDINALIGMLKNKSWGQMRKWVAQQSNLDLTFICRSLYGRADEFMAKESIPTFTILTSEYQYRNSFVPDKEINAVAFLTQVMGNCEFLQ